MSSDRSRSQVLSMRAAVLAASLVALLSLGTGLANITVGVTLDGPLAPFVPDIIQQAAGFTGTLTGFVMLMSTWALRRRLRVGWYATMLLLPLTAAQGLIQASIYSMPLVVLSLISIPTLAFNRRRFDRPAALSSTQIAALIALTGTVAYGTAGTYALRDDFTEVESLLDAFYYTIVTASTVGYGDLTPITQEARVFSLSVVVLGTASFAVALGSVLGPAIEARFARALGTMTDTNYDLLEEHVIILGFGDLTEPILDELNETEVVVVTQNNDAVTWCRNRDINVVVGDPSEEEPLRSAGIGHAKAVIAATENDAEDAFAILTARELNPEARIVAAATARQNLAKLRRAGADTVLSPAMIGGQLLGQSALGTHNLESITDRFE